MALFLVLAATVRGPASLHFPRRSSGHGASQRKRDGMGCYPIVLVCNLGRHARARQSEGSLGLTTGFSELREVVAAADATGSSP
jgi:hypothetical protein